MRTGLTIFWRRKDPLQSVESLLAHFFVLPEGPL